MDAAVFKQCRSSSKEYLKQTQEITVNAIMSAGSLLVIYMDNDNEI